jgi:hypothetical protein
MRFNDMEFEHVISQFDTEDLDIYLTFTKNVNVFTNCKHIWVYGYNLTFSMDKKEIITDANYTCENCGKVVPL